MPGLLVGQASVPVDDGVGTDLRISSFIIHWIEGDGIENRKWRGEDSNLRRRCRQIYSLLPLATWEPLPMSRLSTGKLR